MAKSRRKKKLKKGPKRLFGICFLIFSAYIALEVVNYYWVLNSSFTPVEIHEEGYYYASDFGINVITSEYDYDNDGIDDYTDILLGAKKEHENNPAYVNKYYDGGYPPEDEGVCTDTIWRSLKEAGYNLKDMMIYDIKKDQQSETYRYDIEVRDDNIDFRRVNNQEVFFETYAESLTTNIYNIEEFMPGDIITFDDSAHIALISDKRNASGIPYVIQNRDETQEEKEEDRLEITDMKVTGHYRFTLTNEIERLMNNI